MQQSDKIIKIDRIHYVKSKNRILEGHLWLTKTHLILEAKKTHIGFFELLLDLINLQSLEKTYGFEITRDSIHDIHYTINHHHKHLLFIKDQYQRTHTILLWTNNGNEWMELLTK